MSDDIAIKVESVSKDFILPHKKRGTLKSFFLSPFSKYDRVKQHALSDISFEVKKGEFFGIVGRNGSGKSTLLKCLAGVYTPNQGNIEINGSLVPFIELGVGFDPELSGRDNVYLNAALLGFSRNEAESLYDEIVEFAELEEFMDQKLKNYSSGMQVRLAFSIAIRAKSDILLLDEVLAVGDSAFQRKCSRYFEDIKNSDTTVILVTHDMNAVQRFCDRAILLEKGEMVKEGSAQSISDEYRDINMTSKSGGEPALSDKKENVTIKILEQSDKKLVFKIQHKEKKDEGYYFGFSVIKDGVTFAELNNLGSDTSKITKKSLTYELDITQFNPGVYELGAVLFKENGREAVAYTKIRPQFIIKGLDVNRGGALKLNATWKQH